MTLTDKERKLQGIRRRMTSISVINLTMQSIVVFLFAWAGQVEWHAAAASSAIGIGLAMTFYVVIATNLNMRLRDPELLMPQLLCSFVLQLVLVVWIPTLWLLFLLGILVTYNFAMLSFTKRQFTITWVGLGLGIGAAMYLSRERFGYPDANGLTMSIFWLVFVAVLNRLSVIGAQFSLLQGQLSKKNRLLSESLAHIERLASRDDLTGAYNRRVFMGLVTEEAERVARTGQPFCVAMFDMDNFKQINDRFGHSTGDAVLRRFCDAVHAGMRSTDRFGRYGGEEFVLLLTSTPADVAWSGVQRLCEEVGQVDWEMLAHGLHVTVSAGLACHRPGESIASLLERADLALYDAKHNGRNRCMMAP